MNRGPLILAAGAIAFAASTASGGDASKSWSDPAGDAVIRRTDPNLAGVLGAGCTIPNLLRLTMGGWQSTSPATDPYTGTPRDPEDAHLLRFDLELQGLVNPPGSASPSFYSPFTFGPSPLYGYIEFDVDDDRDTGGELGSSARSRYLSNVGRFGRLPYGSISERAVRFGWDIDSNFFTAPQFERSGADFFLSFCGCFATTIVSGDGNANGIFDAGESWIVRSGFFQRSGGYQAVCSSSGGAGGLQPGLYIPQVNLRWSHSIASDRTIITLIFPSTMTGAGQLAGEPAQPVNLNAGDQASLVEALTDLIDSAPFATPGTPEWHLINRWVGEQPDDPHLLDPTRWSVRALVGTAYVEPVNGAVFAWTDTGFDEVARDLDADGMATTFDKQVVFDAMDALDGTARDGEGVGSENGNVRLINPGINFALADVTGDGNINRFDAASLCLGDFNLDGVINILDYMGFFNAYTIGDHRADLNCNGILDSGDFVTFLNAIAIGC